MYFLDTETCGFHGPAVLIQTAIDDGLIDLHEVFCSPIIDTLLLIEDIASHEEGVCGFNMAYDWFHINKIYTMLKLLGDKVGNDAEPRDHIDLLAELEPLARDGDCVKPVKALDLMLHARKGPFQSTMDRKEIRLKRVPKVLAALVAQQLEQRIPLPDLYFMRNKDKGVGDKWKIHPIINTKTKQPDPDFVDIILKFQPSSALKALVIHAGLREKDKRLLFSQVAAEPKPIEAGWAPFALAISNPDTGWHAKVGSKEGYTWPAVVDRHVTHWRFDDLARQYAADDVEDLRRLKEYFGHPESNDVDSIIACMVGAVRWRGFAINADKVRELMAIEEIKIKKAPKAPHHVLHYLSEVMHETELAVLTDKKTGKIGTKKVLLENLTKMMKDCTCCTYTTEKIKVDSTHEAFGEVTEIINRIRHADANCVICHGKGEVRHPGALRAELVLDARKGYTKNVLYRKLLDAGRLHAAASVIGSLSGRVSGRTEVADGKRAGNINSLGIQHDKVVRAAFPLAMGNHQLNLGDFDAYEVSIADAAYNDPDLREQLLTCYACAKPRTVEQYEEIACPNCNGREKKCKKCKGSFVAHEIESTCPYCQAQVVGEGESTLRKIHGLFAQELVPGTTYDDILKTKGTSNDLYDKGKRGIFSQFYGGNEQTLVERLGVSLEVATEASKRFKLRYKGVGAEYQRCYENHCSMRQPDGLGSKVYWHDPAEYVESLNGFRRDFSLENKITKALFLMAENPPKPWLQLKIKVVRRDREQNVGNAVRSALLAAAFQIQAQCMRAALNHRIQSTGAIETKKLQRDIWELQPAGIHPWVVQPFNIHDEVLAPALPEVSGKIEEIVKQFVRKTKSLIPLIKMAWKSNALNWAEK